MTDEGSARRNVVVLLAAVLFVHLGAAIASRRGIVQDDAESYVVLARNLSHGAGYVFEPDQPPTSWRAPGYPAFLAAIFLVSGGSLQAARVAHAVIWTLTALLTYLLARRLFGSSSSARQALLAAAFVGLYPELVGFTGLLWSENLSIGLVVAALLAIVWAVRDRASWPGLILAGSLVGACVLTRSTSLVLFPVLGFVAWRSDRRPAIARAAVVAAVGLIVVGAWAARNTRLHHRFMLVESNVGFNLYAGHSPDTPIPFAWKKIDRIHEDARYRELTRGLSESEANASLTHAAVANMKAHPLREIGLAVGKAFDFWLPDFFISRNIRSGSLGPEWRRFGTPALVLTAACHLAALAAAARYAWRNRRELATQLVVLTAALYTAPHMLVYGASRYHLPLMPLVLMLAASEVVRGRDSRRVAAAQASVP